MTFPKSVGATRNSNTVTCSPCHFADDNLVGQIHKSFRDVFDELLHVQVCLLVV